jgi:hypothetical protein
VVPIEEEAGWGFSLDAVQKKKISFPCQELNNVSFILLL